MVEKSHLGVYWGISKCYFVLHTNGINWLKARTFDRSDIGKLQETLNAIAREVSETNDFKVVVYFARTTASEERTRFREALREELTITNHRKARFSIVWEFDDCDFEEFLLIALKNRAPKLVELAEPAHGHLNETDTREQKIKVECVSGGVTSSYCVSYTVAGQRLTRLGFLAEEPPAVPVLKYDEVSKVPGGNSRDLGECMEATNLFACFAQDAALYVGTALKLRSMAVRVTVEFEKEIHRDCVATHFGNGNFMLPLHAVWNNPSCVTFSRDISVPGAGIQVWNKDFIDVARFKSMEAKNHFKLLDAVQLETLAQNRPLFGFLYCPDVGIFRVGLRTLCASQLSEIVCDRSLLNALQASMNKCVSYCEITFDDAYVEPFPGWSGSPVFGMSASHHPYLLCFLFYSRNGRTVGVSWTNDLHNPMWTIDLNIDRDKRRDLADLKLDSMSKIDVERKKVLNALSRTDGLLNSLNLESTKRYLAQTTSHYEVDYTIFNSTDDATSFPNVLGVLKLPSRDPQTSWRFLELHGHFDLEGALHAVSWRTDVHELPKASMVKPWMLKNKQLIVINGKALKYEELDEDIRYYIENLCASEPEQYKKAMQDVQNARTMLFAEARKQLNIATFRFQGVVRCVLAELGTRHQWMQCWILHVIKPNAQSHAELCFSDPVNGTQMKRVKVKANNEQVTWFDEPNSDSTAKRNDWHYAVKCVIAATQKRLALLFETDSTRQDFVKSIR